MTANKAITKEKQILVFKFMVILSYKKSKVLFCSTFDVFLQLYLKAENE